MQIIPLNSRVVTSPTVRVNIKRRIREAVRLIVTRGAGVNASREGLKVVFHASDIGADKWIVPGVLLLLSLSHAPPQRFFLFCY